MKEYMMIMKGGGPSEDWPAYIKKLVDSGSFRGGSAFGDSGCFSKQASQQECVAVGYMRFIAENRAQVEALLPGNPVWETGGAVEIHELVET